MKHGFDGNMAVYGWQFVNSILPQNTCLFCYIIPILWIKNSYCLIISTNYFINQQMLNIKGLK